MSKAKEISALWKQIKPQIGELVRLCHEVESHAEVTADAYQRGYETAKHEYEDCTKPVDNGKAYQMGLSDAWEAARKIANMPYNEEEKAFGSGGWAFIEKHTASEAIEKIRQYEQEKEEEIQVGDEVKSIERGWTAVVVRISNDDSLILMDSSGAIADAYNKTMFVKTGRHFPEIAEVFAKMKE